MYKITHNKEACIGCGSCAALCPENWEMTPEGKSRPKKTEIEELGCNKDAEQACPVGAIKIEEVKK